LQVQTAQAWHLQVCDDTAMGVGKLGEKPIDHIARTLVVFADIGEYGAQLVEVWRIVLQKKLSRLGERTYISAVSALSSRRPQCIKSHCGHWIAQSAHQDRVCASSEHRTKRCDEVVP
jgi:hypothetical protein